MRANYSLAHVHSLMRTDHQKKKKKKKTYLCNSISSEVNPGMMGNLTWIGLLRVG